MWERPVGARTLKAAIFRDRVECFFADAGNIVQVADPLEGALVIAMPDDRVGQFGAHAGQQPEFAWIGPIDVDQQPNRFGQPRGIR